MNSSAIFLKAAVAAEGRAEPHGAHGIRNIPWETQEENDTHSQAVVSFFYDWYIISYCYFNVVLLAFCFLFQNRPALSLCSRLVMMVVLGKHLFRWYRLVNKCGDTVLGASFRKQPFELTFNQETIDSALCIDIQVQHLLFTSLIRKLSPAGSASHFLLVLLFTFYCFCVLDMDIYLIIISLKTAKKPNLLLFFSYFFPFALN